MSECVHMPLKLWFNTGELSGDMQAGLLLQAIKELEPDCEARGMGGPNLENAGQKNDFDISALSVMGVVEVLSAIPRALMLVKKIRETLLSYKPDAIILVDAPEFNFLIARAVHSLKIPVYYFIPPKIWAWNRGRVKILRRYVNAIFSILPFEEDFYRSMLVKNVEYVGNPIVDAIADADIEDIPKDPNLIGILPGSRVKEVTNLMPIFMQAAKKIRTSCPEVKFKCLLAPGISEELLRSFIPSDDFIEIVKNVNTYKFMKTCSSIISASGTAVLESALCGVPTLVCYRVSSISACVIRHIIQVRYVGLPNLIMDREIFPELLQNDCTPDKISNAILNWRLQPETLNPILAGMKEISLRCGEKGAAKRCARSIISKIKG